MIKRVIPSTGEELPVIGLGTWKRFDVSSSKMLEPLTEVLGAMHKSGATVIDSSPMYGNAETVVGALTGNAAWQDYFFYATKVWTTGKQEGIKQMQASFSKMKRKTMDLMQIHNLTDWKTHLQTLKDWKAEGKIRYIGITHYTDSMHGELENIIKKETIDFVQFNYSIFSRNAEKSLLKTAADRGVATIVNRPFGEGRDFDRVKTRALPAWAPEQGIDSWSRFFLAYIISNPAVTVVIPATGNPAHALEDFSMAHTEPLSQAFREKMADFVDQLV